MAHQPDYQSDKAKLGGAVLLTVSGISAAFGVAACCALPIFLATAGIGTAWLAGIASIAAPYREIWIVISALSLLISAFLLLRAHQNPVRFSSEERRGGKEVVSQCSTRWWPAI